MTIKFEIPPNPKYHTIYSPKKLILKGLPGNRYSPLIKLILQKAAIY